MIAIILQVGSEIEVADVHKQGAYVVYGTQVQYCTVITRQQINCPGW